jgi:hypothetical protein
MPRLFNRLYSSPIVFALVLCFYTAGAVRAIIPGLCATQREASCCAREAASCCAGSTLSNHTHSQGAAAVRPEGSQCAFCKLVNALVQPPAQRVVSVPVRNVEARLDFAEFRASVPVEWRFSFGRAPPSSLFSNTSV